MSNADFSVEFTFTDQELSKLTDAIEKSFGEYDIEKKVKDGAEAGTEEALKDGTVKVDDNESTTEKTGASVNVDAATKADLDNLISSVEAKMDVNESIYSRRIKEAYQVGVNPSGSNLLSAKLVDALNLIDVEFTKERFEQAGMAPEDVPSILNNAKNMQNALQEMFRGKEGSGVLVRDVGSEMGMQNESAQIKSYFQAVGRLVYGMEQGRMGQGGETFKGMKSTTNATLAHDALARAVGTLFDMEGGESVLEKQISGSKERIDVLNMGYKGLPTEAVEVKTGGGAMSVGDAVQNAEKLLNIMPKNLSDVGGMDEVWEYFGQLRLGSAGKEQTTPENLRTSFVESLSGKYGLPIEDVNKAVAPTKDFIKYYKPEDAPDYDKVVADVMKSLIKRVQSADIEGEESQSGGMIGVLKEVKSMMKFMWGELGRDKGFEMGKSIGE